MTNQDCAILIENYLDSNSAPGMSSAPALDSASATFSASPSEFPSPSGMLIYLNQKNVINDIT